MNMSEKDEQMDRVPSDVIYGLTLDGRGGMQPLAAGSEIPAAQPGWLHLDYGNPEAARWLLQTPLLGDAARESLLGQSNRPKLVRMGETVLLILRGINHNKDHRPEEMVALRIFITPDLIISSRRRPLLSEKDVFEQLKQGGGADTPADWLVEICDALTDRAGEFVEELHDQILDLEEQVLMRDLPANGRLALIRKQLIMIRRYLSPNGIWWRASPTRRSAGWMRTTGAACSTSPTGCGAGSTIWMPGWRAPPCWRTRSTI